MASEMADQAGEAEVETAKNEHYCQQKHSDRYGALEFEANGERDEAARETDAEHHRKSSGTEGGHADEGAQRAASSGGGGTGDVHEAARQQAVQEANESGGEKRRPSQGIG